MFKLTGIIWEEEGKFVSKCPELEVASCGDTPQEALRNLEEAVELYIENATELGFFDDIRPAIESSQKYTTTFEVTI